jgi:hypothetical protein
MKISIKHNLIVFHNPKDWAEINNRLILEHGPAITISWRCKRELGFTVRRHQGLEPHSQENWKVMKDQGWQNRYHYQDQIHPDFYDQACQSFFVLKYLNK